MEDDFSHLRNIKISNKIYFNRFEFLNETLTNINIIHKGFNNYLDSLITSLDQKLNTKNLSLFENYFGGLVFKKKEDTQEEEEIPFTFLDLMFNPVEETYESRVRKQDIIDAYCLYVKDLLNEEHNLEYLKRNTATPKYILEKILVSQNYEERKEVVNKYIKIYIRDKHNIRYLHDSISYILGNIYFFDGLSTLPGYVPEVVPSLNFCHKLYRESNKNISDAIVYITSTLEENRKKDGVSYVEEYIPIFRTNTNVLVKSMKRYFKDKRKKEKNLT
jgi:hypothetical protein